MSKQKSMYVAEITLKPDVSGAELETLWAEEFLPNATELPGFKPTLYKGHNGQREGQYLIINYFVSAERVGELFPGATFSEEFKEWMAANPVYEKAMSHTDGVSRTVYREIS